MRKITYKVYYKGKVYPVKAKTVNDAIRKVFKNEFKMAVPKTDRNTVLPKDVYVEPLNGWKTGKLSMIGRQIR